MFINLCMFRVTMSPSSGATTVFMRHLVLVILCGWLCTKLGLFTRLYRYARSTKHKITKEDKNKPTKCTN